MDMSLIPLSLDIPLKIVGIPWSSICSGTCPTCSIYCRPQGQPLMEGQRSL